MRKGDFNTEKAELYETLGHPTRILILQALSEKPMSFSELKRRANIDSSGNLSFHLNKLGHLVRTTSDGNYALSDEGREAIRVVEATERVGSATASAPIRIPNVARTEGRRSRSRIIVAVLLITLLVLGVSMTVTGSIFGPETQLIPSSSDGSPTNFTLQPDGQEFWFGTNALSGPWHVVYVVRTTGGAPGDIELQIDGYSRSNGTYVLTTQSYVQDDYVDTYMSFPYNEFVNFTLVNHSGGNVTIIDAFIHFDQVTYPYQSLGNTLTYLGSALVVFDVGLAVWWFLRGYTKKKTA